MCKNTTESKTGRIEDYGIEQRSSVLRNKLIANALYRFNDFESFGSGLKGAVMAKKGLRKSRW